VDGAVEGVCDVDGIRFEINFDADGAVGERNRINIVSVHGERFDPHRCSVGDLVPKIFFFFVIKTKRQNMLQSLEVLVYNCQASSKPAHRLAHYEMFRGLAVWMTEARAVNETDKNFGILSHF